MVTDFNGKVVYLAGPSASRSAFNALTNELTQAGSKVFNPATEPDGLSEAAYMQIGLARVPHADCVVCLPGAEVNEFASTQINLAKTLQKLLVNPDYALLIRYARKLVGYTQEEAAHVYGVSDRHYKNYELGHTPINHELAEIMIRQVFKLDLHTVYAQWVVSHETH